jgi:hypothetical protein
MGQRAQRFNPELIRRRELGQELSNKLGNRVKYGIFQGLQLVESTWWGSGDRAGMLLGLYEREVAEWLSGRPAGSKLIDVGAADGFYAVGAVACLSFDYAYCFESSQEGRLIIPENAQLNGVEQLVDVRHTCTPTSLLGLVHEHNLNNSRTVILIDIEGGEWDLLAPDVLTAVAACTLIVELHEFDRGAQERLATLLEHARENFSATFLRTGARNPNIFPEISDWSDDDRWAICSEGRECQMRWLVLEPLETDPDFVPTAY